MTPHNAACPWCGKPKPVERMATCGNIKCVRNYRAEEAEFAAREAEHEPY